MSNQGHTMTLHLQPPTNVPTMYQLPTPYAARPPTHPDTMGENNMPTALKGYGVKMEKQNRKVASNVFKAHICFLLYYMSVNFVSIVIS